MCLPFNMWRCVNIANNKNDLPINEDIKVEQMMVIGPNGEQMGIKSLDDALTLSNYAGLDLVLMNANPEHAVAKIMDYNKFRYEKQKRIKEQQKKQRENNKEIKEYRFTIATDVHDFETRKKNAIEYLKKGHKIKASLRFKGRQLAHPELGKQMLLKFAESLSEYSDIEQKPKQEGRSMFMLIAPKKEERK